jgi:hypothetical protein
MSRLTGRAFGGNQAAPNQATFLARRGYSTEVNEEPNEFNLLPCILERLDYLVV